jgi:hypothetical protein
MTLCSIHKQCQFQQFLRYRKCNSMRLQYQILGQSLTQLTVRCSFCHSDMNFCSALFNVVYIVWFNIDFNWRFPKKMCGFQAIKHYIGENDPTTFILQWDCWRKMNCQVILEEVNSLQNYLIRVILLIAHGVHLLESLSVFSIYYRLVFDALCWMEIKNANSWKNGFHMRRHLCDYKF